MLKSKVLAYFNGSHSLVAQELGITRQAVYLWPRIVPQTSAYKLQVLTRGKLKVDPSKYRKNKRKRPPRDVPAMVYTAQEAGNLMADTGPPEPQEPPKA